MIQPSIILSGLSFEPYFEEAFSNYLINFTASLLEFRDSVTLFAEALISLMSRDGITRSARIFLEELDLLIESIIVAIYLLKATSWESDLSLCSMI